MSKRIRFGCSVKVTWTIRKYGTPLQLDENATVKLYCGDRVQDFEYTVSGNTVTGYFYANTQHKCGMYNLVLIQNYGTIQQVIVDRANAFLLVSHLENGIIEGQDDVDIETDVLINGGSAQGTVNDVLVNNQSVVLNGVAKITIDSGISMSQVDAEISGYTYSKNETDTKIAEATSGKTTQEQVNTAISGYTYDKNTIDEKVSGATGGMSKEQVDAEISGYTYSKNETEQKINQAVSGKTTQEQVNTTISGYTYDKNTIDEKVSGATGGMSKEQVDQEISGYTYSKNETDQKIAEATSGGTGGMTKEQVDAEISGYTYSKSETNTNISNAVSGKASIDDIQFVDYSGETQRYTTDFYPYLLDGGRSHCDAEITDETILSQIDSEDGYQLFSAGGNPVYLCKIGNDRYIWDEQSNEYTLLPRTVNDRGNESSSFTIAKTDNVTYAINYKYRNGKGNLRVYFDDTLSFNEDITVTYSTTTADIVERITTINGYFPQDAYDNKVVKMDNKPYDTIKLYGYYIDTNTLSDWETVTRLYYYGNTQITYRIDNGDYISINGSYLLPDKWHVFGGRYYIKLDSQRHRVYYYVNKRYKTDGNMPFSVHDGSVARYGVIETIYRPFSLSHSYSNGSSQDIDELYTNEILTYLDRNDLAIVYNDLYSKLIQGREKEIRNYGIVNDRDEFIKFGNAAYNHDEKRIELTTTFQRGDEKYFIRLWLTPKGDITTVYNQVKGGITRDRVTINYNGTGYSIDEGAWELYNYICQQYWSSEFESIPFILRIHNTVNDTWVCGTPFYQLEKVSNQYWVAKAKYDGKTVTINGNETNAIVRVEEDKNIVSLTQTQYDLLETKDNNTLYIITG